MAKPVCSKGNPSALPRLDATSLARADQARSTNAAVGPWHRNRTHMTPGDAAGSERFDVVYLALSGTTTAARCPELLRGLVGLGFATVIALPTPNAARVIAARDLADTAGVRVVESYFDAVIRPRPPFGV